MHKGRFFGILVVLFFLQFAVIANDQLTVDIGKIWFKDLFSQGLVVNLELESENIVLHTRADHLSLASPVYELQDFKLDCYQLKLDTAFFECLDGRLSLSHNGLFYNDFALSFIHDNSKDITQFELNGLMGKETAISLTGAVDRDDWLLSIKANQVDIATFIDLFHPYISEQTLSQLASWEFEGMVNLTVDLQGKKNQLSQIEMLVSSDNFNANDSIGKYVTEQLVFELASTVELQNSVWQWQHQLKLSDGLAYAEPVFLDLFENAINVSAEGDWNTVSQYLNIDSVLFKQKNMGQAQGHYAGTIMKADKIGLKSTDIELATLYPVWIQPFLLQTAASKLEVAGTLSLNFEQTDDEYQLTTRFNDVFVEDDDDGKFGIADLSGTLAWTNGSKPINSLFGWKSGHLYEIVLGKGEVHTQVESSTLTLQQAIQLPVLDGKLQINNFSLQHFPDEKLNWSFDGLLSPVSMEQLSQSLEWPVLHGKLSGVIPQISYINKQVNIEGALMVKLFDGTIIIRDLRLDDPMGPLPQLHANVDMIKLDMDTLTQTFDFGRITGKMNGQIKQLRLSNWQPVEFDASFATPEGDKSRRKISQRAVENLAQIGGGATALLSTSFLRFFKEFSYQKIGLNCYLRNDVCKMSGVEDAPQGYYIVKGGGLPPRINVLGYTREVDWLELVDRLQAVSESSGPVIQ